MGYADTLFNTISDRSEATAARGLRRMPIDLYRDGDHYVLSADLPGVDPGSVDVDLDGQTLTIRAERTLSESDGVKWLNRERTAGTFVRRLSLGQGIDTEGISANYSNGVLSVTLPVSEKAKPRKVQVSTDSVESAPAAAATVATAEPSSAAAA